MTHWAKYLGVVVLALSLSGCGAILGCILHPTDPCYCSEDRPPSEKCK